MTNLRFSGRTAVGTVALLLLAGSGPAFGQATSAAAGVVDPGVRGGPAGAGGALPGLTTLQQQFFTSAQAIFQEIDSVSGTVSGAPGRGLGPRFNADSCAACHQQPAVGGSSPAANPQMAIATKAGATNTVPSFITANGLVREARFIKNPDGTPDGGVHDVFVITGRTDATGCNITQPNFAQAIQQKNIIFRIPTPTFGAGLVENIPAGNLKTDSTNISGPQAALGIASGRFNTSGNDGTITRFGWKGQNKSLLIFAGEAYNVEQGVTSEAFPNERDDTQGCRLNATPEDSTNLAVSEPTASPASDFSSDVVNFAAFMRLTAAPTPAAPTNTSVQGSNQFVNIGCGRCPIPQHTTAQSPFGGQSNVTLTPLSDFALHNMGTACRTRSARARPTASSSAPLRSGDSASACSSFMTAAPLTLSRRSRHTRARARKPIRSSATSTCCGHRISRRYSSTCVRSDADPPVRLAAMPTAAPRRRFEWRMGNRVASRNFAIRYSPFAYLKI
jgi:mono/diheme cytochrome c family protein